MIAVTINGQRHDWTSSRDGPLPGVCDKLGLTGTKYGRHRRYGAPARCI
jgi:hypothetical protein